MPEVDHVDVGRALTLHAGERGEADRAGKMGLAFLQCFRVVGRGHRLFAEAGIIEMLNVHVGILSTAAASESG